MSTKDNISDFHDHSICYATKTIDIFGEIDDKMKSKVLKNLNLLDQVTGEVTIRLSTEGGCVTAGLAIYDAIRAMKNHVRIIAYGEVASMGTVIFQAADKERRFMMRNSYLLLHEGESELSGKEKDIKAQKRLQNWQEERCIEIYYNKIRETRPKYPKNALMKNLDKEWYLFPEEAVEAGLADKILDHY